MYGLAAPGETKKRTLEDDDVAGFCTIYPAAQDPGRCDPVTPPDAGPPDAAEQPTDSDGRARSGSWVGVMFLVLTAGGAVWASRSG